MVLGRDLNYVQLDKNEPFNKSRLANLRILRLGFDRERSAIFKLVVLMQEGHWNRNEVSCFSAVWAELVSWR